MNWLQEWFDERIAEYERDNGEITCIDELEEAIDDMARGV